VTTLAVAVGLTIDTSATLVRVSVSAAGDRPPSYANAALHATRRVFGCFPPASPDWLLRPGKQKTPRRALGKPAYLLTKIGAGEGIRTLDPNLGKVRNRLDPHQFSGVAGPAAIAALQDYIPLIAVLVASLTRWSPQSVIIS
jgi:hypothetical protein